MTQTEIAMYDVPDRDCGPAMRQCTQIQRRFIIALFGIGPGVKGAHQRAALMAGDYTSTNAASVSASRWMDNPTVIAALNEYTANKLRAAGIIGYQALMDVAQDTSPANTGHRVKAGVELLNRAGHIVETVSRVTVEHDIPSDTRTLLEEIKALANDPEVRKALAAPVIDAEFVEVEKDDVLGDGW
jgi:hypothetical protein